MTAVAGRREQMRRDRGEALASSALAAALGGTWLETIRSTHSQIYYTGLPPQATDGRPAHEPAHQHEPGSTLEPETPFVNLVSYWPT